MSNTHFTIFSDHPTKSAVKNVIRQPLQTNFENLGKVLFNGPTKPNEPLKKGETKKTFLSNAGKAWQGTPRQMYSPRPLNIGSLIYNDAGSKELTENDLIELEFTKPVYKYDNYHQDIMDFLSMSELKPLPDYSPPSTPPPLTETPAFELESSYEDEPFIDDFSIGSIPDTGDLGLPDLY